jgi:hypothetical protein
MGVVYKIHPSQCWYSLRISSIKINRFQATQGRDSETDDFSSAVDTYGLVNTAEDMNFRSFQWRFLIGWYVCVLGDWLHGPLVFQMAFRHLEDASQVREGYSFIVKRCCKLKVNTVSKYYVRSLLQ